MENIAIHAVNSPLHTALNLERNSVVCVNCLLKSTDYFSNFGQRRIFLLCTFSRFFKFVFFFFGFYSNVFFNLHNSKSLEVCCMSNAFRVPNK